jgi:PBSX family phage terminase large subunit
VPGPNKVVVRFEPRGAALAMLKSRADMVLVSGAAGSGKSVPAMMKLHLACLQVKRIRCLVVRKTLTSLTASTLVSFREKVAGEAIAAGIVRWYGGSASEPAAYRYPATGSVIVVGGLDQPTRLMSTEYDLAFLDEAVEATAEDVDTIHIRLRNGRLPYQQLLMATNPGAPSHHLKRRADSGGCALLYSRHEDNPLLWQAGEWTERGRTYLARLDSLTGARYQRLRWGRWSSAEGIIYEDFEPAVHVVDRFDPPPSWTRMWGVDFGHTHPFVWQDWAVDPDGRMFLHREQYLTGRLVEDHARDILRHVTEPGPGGGRVWTEPRPRSVVCDHDAEGRATLDRHLGMSTTAATKNVLDGIEAVQARLRPAGDGRPRLFLMRDARQHPADPVLVDAARPTCTADEWAGYIWDTGGGKRVKEAPVKDADDGLDTVRYVTFELDRAARPRVRIMG